jgi:hypothetical protein
VQSVYRVGLNSDRPSLLCKTRRFAREPENLGRVQIAAFPEFIRSERSGGKLLDIEERTANHSAVR